MIVALQPSKNSPLTPGGQVRGWQHEPSLMHTSPLGQVRQVMFGKPHPAAIGWHEGVVTELHVFASQQLPSKHWSPLAQEPALHVIVSPEHGSFQVPQALEGQVVCGVQHVLWSVVEHCSPLAQLPAQFTVWPVHLSVNEAHEFAVHVEGVQHVFWSVAPAAPHCSPEPQAVLQVKVSPLHGSFQVAPQ